VIGIEGTELLVAVEEGGTSELLLFEGQASITDNDGNKKTLFPGDYAEFGGGGGMCVLSYPSNGLRSLVVERFPEFSSFLAARGITTVPKGAITGPSLRPVPDFDELLQASEQNLVQDPQGLTPSKQTLALGQPTLSWPAVHGADSYLVLLAGDAAMEDIVFSAAADGASLTVPLGAPGVAAGRFYFRVIPLGADGQPIAHAYQTWFDSAGWQSEGVLAPSAASFP
jgi:hypothetical protein